MLCGVDDFMEDNIYSAVSSLVMFELWVTLSVDIWQIATSYELVYFCRTLWESLLKFGKILYFSGLLVRIYK